MQNMLLFILYTMYKRFSEIFQHYTTISINSDILFVIGVDIICEKIIYIEFI